MRFQRILTFGVAVAMMLGVATTVAAQQSTGPVHLGYDPTAPMGAHNHDGPLGDKLLFVEQQLRCTCSCTLDAHSCQFQMQCGTSPGWTARIMADLEAGKDEETILAGFVADYGTQVLIAPPAEGFNLVGYLLPAFAIITAGMLIGLVARGRMTQSQLAPVENLSDEDADRLREELERLEEWEAPDW